MSRLSFKDLFLRLVWISFFAAQNVSARDIQAASAQFIEPKQFIVVIDAGHGGVDVGAIRGIFKESEITLKVAKKVQEIIESDSSQKVEVILTREANTTLSLENRVRVAEQNNANLFISLHANSSQAVYVSGMEFYFKKSTQPNKLPDIDSNFTVKNIVGEVANFGLIRQSLKFNKLLQKHIKNSDTDEKTIIKQAPYYVVEKTSMPSALIEIGYISNMSEAKLLLTDQRQQQIAETIVKTIYDFKSDTFTK